MENSLQIRLVESVQEIVHFTVLLLAITQQIDAQLIARYHILLIIVLIYAFLIVLSLTIIMLILIVGNAF